LAAALSPARNRRKRRAMPPRRWPAQDDVERRMTIAQDCRRWSNPIGMPF
jgi:hypothetical protein